MNKVNFDVYDFPKLCEEFHRQKQGNWITFLHDLGYKFQWRHGFPKKKFVEMDEDMYIWFLLRWQ